MSVNISESALEVFRSSMLRKYVQYGHVLNVKPVKERKTEIVEIQAMGVSVYCEKSEFTNRKISTLKGFMGTSVPFIVKDIDVETGYIIVSRVEALPLVQKRFLSMVKEGDRVSGTVTGVLPGANIVFVEVEGFPCMIPPGQYDVNTITNIEEVVAIGQMVDCKVEKIEKVNRSGESKDEDDKEWEFDFRIRLSRRALLKEERDRIWADIDHYHAKGESVMARVVYRLPNPNSYLIEIISSGIVIVGNLQNPLNRQWTIGLPLGIKVWAQINNLDKEKQEGRARIFRVDPTLANARGLGRG